MSPWPGQKEGDGGDRFARAAVAQELPVGAGMRHRVGQSPEPL